MATARENRARAPKTGHRPDGVTDGKRTTRGKGGFGRRKRPLVALNSGFPTEPIVSTVEPTTIPYCLL